VLINIMMIMIMIMRVQTPQLRGLAVNETIGASSAIVHVFVDFEFCRPPKK
jgi:hypothetical membrane protein